MTVDRDISSLKVEALPHQVVLYTTYYRSQSDERQAELNFCLEKNMLCSGIERVVVICEGGIKPAAESPHCLLMHRKQRQTYRDIFNIADVVNPDGINIFINSDIFLTSETIEEIKKRIPPYSKNVLALTRWNWHDGNPEMNQGHDSQDTWAWFGKMNEKVKADFLFGKPGCDNAIAQRLQMYYKVLNPSLSVKTYHVHASGERVYAMTGPQREAETIQPPYFFPSITE